MMLWLIPLLVILISAWLLFRSKKAVINNDAVPVNLQNLLLEHVEYYRNLSNDNQQRFAERIKQFLSNVHIEGVGLDLNNVDRVLIAASAVIPVFSFDNWQYHNLTNVILYPDTFDHQYQFEGNNRNIMGMVGTGYMNGQMLLSKQALYKGFSAASGKSNTGIHEFVHLLDQADGAADGLPEQLMAHQYTEPWLKMMHQEMQRIKVGRSDIDAYALTSEAEFLAVASEYFFEKPEQFRQKHPELYTLLSEIFSVTLQTQSKHKSY